jgi:competence protein ComEA
MAGHEGAERLTGAQRLAALQLPVSAGGWVPDDAEHASDPNEWPAALTEPPGPVTEPPGVSSVELARGWAKDRTPIWLHGAVDRATAGSVLTGVAAIVAVLVALVMVVHRHATTGYAPSFSSSAASPSTASGGSGDGYAAGSPDPATSDAAASIVVDVGGRVRHPGLVTLPTGARVADAIAAAGGPLRHRELTATNLAARVTDGQLLVIGAQPASPPAATDSGTSSSASATAPVDLNSATLDELETLPGIGPVTGQKIIDWRTAHGGFTSVEQLQQVSGIGPATYSELSPLVVP